MTIKKDDTIIRFGKHALCIIADPELGRGLISAFSGFKQEHIVSDSDSMVALTQDYGNGIPLDLAHELITQQNYIARLPELNAESEKQFENAKWRSWFNAATQDVSVVVFSYGNPEHPSYAIACSELAEDENMDKSLSNALGGVVRYLPSSFGERF